MQCNSTSGDDGDLTFNLRACMIPPHLSTGGCYIAHQLTKNLLLPLHQHARLAELVNFLSLPVISLLTMIVQYSRCNRDPGRPAGRSAYSTLENDTTH